MSNSTSGHPNLPRLKVQLRRAAKYAVYTPPTGTYWRGGLDALRVVAVDLGYSHKEIDGWINEVAAPSPGEQVDEDDLAAHIMGDFVSGQEVDPLTATLIDAISSLIARGLLADFNITRK